MPNITEYNAPVQPLIAPNDQAASAALHAGREENQMAREAGVAIGGAISRVGGQLGDAIDRHNAAVQISHGSAQYSALFGDLTQQWNKIASQSDPNDTSVQQGFTEKVLEPSIQKFQQAFEGASPQAQDWAQTRANEMRQHFFVKTSADMGIRAADAAQQNIKNSVSNYSNVVFNDPTALDHAIDAFAADTKAQLAANPYLDAEQASRIHNELVPQATKSIVRSAVYSMGKANPQALLDDVNRGALDKYLDGNDKAEAIRFAEGVKRANIEDENRQYELQKRQQADAQEKAQNNYVSQILSGKGVTDKAIATDPTLTPMQRENLHNFQYEHTRQLKEKVENTPHPEEFRRLLNDMFNQAKADPNNLSVQKIRDSFNAGKLNPREEAELEARFNALDKPMEQNFHSQMLHVERAITTSATMAAQPAVAAQIVNQIESDAYQTLNKARNAGQDVTPLLDPRSKDYLFAPAKLQTYMGTPQQQVAKQADTVRQSEGAIEFNGYRFPNKAALDAYKKSLEGK